MLESLGLSEEDAVAVVTAWIVIDQEAPTTDCPACGLKMGGTSCVTGIDKWTIPDTEGWADLRILWLANPWPCPDCGCPPGGMHHLGCAIERCPCGTEQAICCKHYNQRLRGVSP